MTDTPNPKVPADPTAAEDPDDTSKLGKASVLLDHVEKTLADNYRKEIDQEENVWRTLPFFAAVLALEVTALVQLREKLLTANGFISYIVAGIAVVVALANVAALYFLARSIAFADFKYIASEPEVLRYSDEVEQAAKNGVLKDGESAVTTVKRFLARQYAATTENNRAINQHRAAMRTTAGLITLGSVLGTLVLGALTVLAPVTQIADTAKVQSGGFSAERPSSVSPGSPSPAGPPSSSPPAAANADPTADPRRLEGVVHPQRDDRDGGASGERK